MNQNKISLLSILKHSNLPFKVEPEHVFLILLNNSVTLPEVRRYLNIHPLGSGLYWHEMREDQIENMSKEAQKYIKASRQVWREEDKRYSQQIQQITQIKLTVLPLLQLTDKEQTVDMVAALQLKLQERNESLKIHMNTEAESSICQENQNINLLIQLLRETSIYKREIQQQHLTKLTDQQDRNYIQTFLKQSKTKLQAEEQQKKDSQRKAVFDKIQDYQRKVISLKKRLYQIFLFYCRENKSAGLTFQQYGRSSQLIDLRLFLKYFKDFQYVEANKYRFKVTTSTQLFRNAATNGLSLSFQQFWNIHRQLFELKDLTITRRDIIEADPQKLPVLQHECQQEISKLKQLNDIVSEQKVRQLLKFVTIKTQTSSPQKVYIKNNSGLMAASKVTSNQSSKYLPKKAFSDMESQLLSSKNFIQRVRAELQNVQEHTPRAKIDRSNSLSTLSPMRRGGPLQVSLPKILKLSTQQLSSQNIYQSLKRFSDEDYRNQQKKLRDLIGLSRGQEDNLMNHYLSRQRQDKQQKQREKSLERQIKRKKLLDSLAKKQHHCKKFNPKEIQPYMRF